MKNGQVVSDGFTATDEMNLPSYIDRRTCSVYRVEKDGTYTKLEYVMILKVQHPVTDIFMKKSELNLHVLKQAQ